MERYGDFELQKLIATGGMAEIYLARHGGYGDFSRTVVVKRMLPQLAVRPDFVQMFLDEARLASNLNHPNIVSVFNLGQVDDSYFIAMEFVDGPHLGSLFAHSLRQRKALPLDHCVYIVARAADGLHYAHEHVDPATGHPLNVVHRDISPQNILVSRTGEVKVTDFGVAKASTQQSKTRTGIIKGKVSYMSPEQCLGEIVDRRTDVFALGIVLYELLTRRRLFRDKSDLLIMQKITGNDAAAPSLINRELDAELDAICKRALARDRESRFQSAAELAEALDAWLSSKHTGDTRAQLQRWFELNALELTIGVSLEQSSPQSVPQSAPQVRSALPSGTTAATPTLQSSAPGTRHSPSDLFSPPTEAVALPSPEGNLPDRSHIADEPTQRAESPASAASDTLYGDLPIPDATDEKAAALSMGDQAPPALPNLSSSRSTHRGTNRLLRATLGAVGVGVIVLVGFVGVGKGADEEVIITATVADAGEVAVPLVVLAPATITVESVPAGIAVVLDEDRVVGKTPLTFDHAPGVVKLQAQFKDQPPLDQEIVVAPGEIRVVRMLARMPLVVTSTPSNAKVRVNGELLGETPFEKPGLVDPETPVRIKLELTGWEFGDRMLTPTAGDPLVIEMVGTRQTRAVKDVVVPPPPKFGLLNMRSSPWVFVKIGREKIGSTTFLNAKVPAGRQTLVLSNPEVGIADTLVVVIPEDKTLNVSLEWEKKGTDWRLKSRSVK